MAAVEMSSAAVGHQDIAKLKAATIIRSDQLTMPQALACRRPTARSKPATRAATPGIA